MSEEKISPEFPAFLTKKCISFGRRKIPSLLEHFQFLRLFLRWYLFSIFCVSKTLFIISEISRCLLMAKGRLLSGGNSLFLSRFIQVSFFRIFLVYSKSKSFSSWLRLFWSRNSAVQNLGLRLVLFCSSFISFLSSEISSRRFSSSSGSRLRIRRADMIILDVSFCSEMRLNAFKLDQRRLGCLLQASFSDF